MLTLNDAFFAIRDALTDGADATPFGDWHISPAHLPINEFILTNPREDYAIRLSLGVTLTRIDKEHTP